MYGQDGYGGGQSPAYGGDAYAAGGYPPEPYGGQPQAPPGYGYQAPGTLEETSLFDTGMIDAEQLRRYQEGRP